MSGAGEALASAAMEALEGIGGLAGVFDGAPLQASAPFAMVEAGPETDWSHKSGEGREVRIAVTIRDEGERPTRLRRLMGEAEAAVAGIGGGLDGWRLVTMRFLRSRAVREGRRGLAGVVEFRARMMRE